MTLRLSDLKGLITRTEGNLVLGLSLYDFFLRHVSTMHVGLLRSQGRPYLSARVSLTHSTSSSRLRHKAAKGILYQP